jgi:hypothetical protein
VDPYATIDDLLARFPRALTGPEAAQAEVMLDDASFLLSINTPGLQAAIDGGNENVTHEAMLLTVVMVRRSLLAQAAQQSVNPGVDQVSEAWGPYSRSVKYKTDSGNLWLYDREWESLLALLRGDTAAAVSMRSPGF